MFHNNLINILVAVFLVLLISGFTIFKVSDSTSPDLKPPKKFDDYKSNWKKVDSLIELGLPQSALTETEIIYNSAKLQNNHPQLIKATLYRIKLKADYEEEFIEKIVSDLKSELETAEAPVKQIFHSIIADLYWRYYQANRYVFMNRKSVVNIDLLDIKTWDLKILMNNIISHYNSSLEEADLLKKINLKEYDVVLLTEDDSKLFRPTLYDFLAHRAADFFMHDESSLLQPADAFELDKIEYFEETQEFSQLKLESQDSLSLKYYALNILQDLISFHQLDEDPSALSDVNLKRLAFVHQYSILPSKDTLYFQSLVDFEKKILFHKSSAQVSYKIAFEYFQQGRKFNPLISDNYKWDIKKAHEKCNEAINRFPESYGAKNCRGLLMQIEKVHISFTCGKENVPESPILGLLEFKNIQKANFRIIKLDYETERSFRKDYRATAELIKKYVAMDPLMKWVQEIPDEGDFQMHSTEVKLPALPYGYYIILISDSEEFDIEKNNISYTTSWITNLSYISQVSPKAAYKFYVLDRESGNAIKDVNVNLYYRKYDYQSRNYSYNKGGEFISDENGFFEVDGQNVKEGSNSFLLEFIRGEDKYVTDDRFYQSGYHPPEMKKQVKTFFFTDRAIYRPGQMIHFKGIVLEKYDNKWDIKSGFNTKVEFKDVNYQNISELDLRTNDFGSFNGSFVAPVGGLNGRMTIKNESGSIPISIEEYKRPKFEVVFEPIEGSYKLNETVTVGGKAKAFAGNNISGATVKYRVVRATFFPWRYSFINFYFSQPSMEIANGFTQTDEDGRFTIDFEAIPDYGIPKKYQPTYGYTIYADVTDVNNETQSSTTWVSVGYKALLVELDLKDMLEINDLSSFKILTKNLNGQKVSASGKISVSKLEQNERLLRSRLWKEPDVFLMDEVSFVKDFPNDAYKDDLRTGTYKIESEVFQTIFDTEKDSIIDLSQVSNWKPGEYLVKVITSDIYGTEVIHEKQLILYDQKGKKSPVKKIDWFFVIKQKCEPGENVQFIMGSADKNVKVLYEVVYKDEVLHKEFVKLSNEQKYIEYPVTEELRGGFSVNLIFIKHNRVFNNSFNVTVPFSNKELDFEFLTFRDKLKPGQKEEWKIKVKGHKGELAASEILTSMYDASLDAFISNNWEFQLYHLNFGQLRWSASKAFNLSNSVFHQPNQIVNYFPEIRSYDQLNWFGFNYFGHRNLRKGMRTEAITAMPGQAEASYNTIDAKDEEMEDVVTAGEKTKEIDPLEKKLSGDTESLPQVRRDFKETAFFYPNLSTDENGDVIISFTMPESLTRWKLMGLAYTKDLSYGQFQKEVITQKELMIVPNPPRFMRQGDEMKFSAKVVNLSENDLEGSAELRFFHSSTMKDITNEVLKDDELQEFDVEKGGSGNLNWDISIPAKYDVISYHIMANSGNFSDGEEKPLPVLTNRMLVTESLPLPVKGNEIKVFSFEKLKKSGNNKSLVNHKLSLEFTSNPAWYAVQALPYIMENQHESADNVFLRFYANSIASYIANSNPRIKQVFDTWKIYSPDALLSNLEKNQELKSLILNETPWVRDAKNENERKHRVAVLFDLNKMIDEQGTAIRKLAQKQSGGGGWPWYKGMRDNRNVSQRIVTGFGQLRNLGVFDAMNDDRTKSMVIKAIRYLDQEIKDDYNNLKKHSENNMEENHLGNIHIQYLYARSYFRDEVEISKSVQNAFDYYYGQAKKYWNKQGNYQKGMIALALNRFGEEEIPTRIMNSVKEHAVYSDEMGMYWRDNSGGYYWYQAPVETQSLLIEAFDEVKQDKESVERMKIWLLKQKQTQDWKTTSATANAVYALLLQGSDWLANDKLAEISIGDKVIDPFELEDTKIEAGTGYFKTSWSGNEVKPDMGNIKVKNENESIAWGAVYWQYFEDLDKITFAETPLKLDKKLFVERNTKSGPVIDPVEDEASISVGDKIIVRIEIRVDRNMEFVHMKDMRASAFEPVNVISGYRYSGGLGYYESTLDASTNFFFDYLRKGTYVFEYALVASQEGNFSNGITTIQCMYAPEFTSHSEGVRVTVK